VASRKPKEVLDRPLLGIPLMIIALILVIGGSAFWYVLKYGASAPKAPVLTSEAKAYVRYLKLADVEMKAHESYVKQAIVEIVGKITNAGERPLKQVQLNCVFYDPYGQVVLRERVAIVRAKAGGLNPGETKSFRLAFDSLPASWNNAMPQLVIASIDF